MPIYEFQCNRCGSGFELLVRSRSGRNRPQCPSCSTRDVARLLSMFAMSGGGGDGQGGGRTKSCAGCSASSCAGCR